MMFIRITTFFLGVLATLFIAWVGLVVVPGIQISEIKPSPELKPYTEQQLRGRAIYIREGCIYCHSQQTRPAGFGADQLRNWGRPSVPGDYVYDKPHLLGTSRTGPDLFNIAARQPSEDWHLIHLYNPRAVSPGSIMPPFPWLFKEEDAVSSKYIYAASGERVVPVPKGFAPEGKVIIATQGALDLVAYLLSLDHTYPIEEKNIGTAGVAPKFESKESEGGVNGGEVYTRICVSCHQTNGQGIPGAFPPLAGSDWLLKDTETPIRIVIHGLQGAIEIKGMSYNGVMPEWGSKLSDEEIAAVITHERRSWGNSAGGITPEMVGKVRKETANRTTPWTPEELQKLSGQNK
ncbi:MAG: cytochrome-c oxidase [Candidatus Dadabacteria bacterium]